MTENEALKIFESEVVILDCWIENDKDIIANCDTEDDEFDDDKELAELSLKDYSERKELFKTAISALKEIQQYREIGSVKECKEMASIVKKSERSELANIIDEWIEYRKSGTVEECKEMAVIANKKTNPDELAKIIVEWIQYNKIGTVEECREAVEKQKPKKPKDSLKINPVIDGNGAYVDADMTVYLLCPNCGEMVGIDENVDKFCRECGQTIDTENLEGMEDEGKAI